MGDVNRSSVLKIITTLILCFLSLIHNVRPSDVDYINLTWTSGQKKYRYHFDQLTSLNEDVLLPPVISIKPKGKIPKEPTREFDITFNEPLIGSEVFSIRQNSQLHCHVQTPHRESQNSVSD